jgi:hypothetical protein
LNVLSGQLGACVGHKAMDKARSCCKQKLLQTEKLLVFFFPEQNLKQDKREELMAAQV